MTRQFRFFGFESYRFKGFAALLPIIALCAVVPAISPARDQSDLSRAYSIIASKTVRRSHPQFRTRDAGLVRLRPGQILACRRSENARALHHRQGRLPHHLLRDGRPIRHPCRSAGAFRRERHHHGPDSAEGDDPAAGRARRYALPRQGSQPRLLGRRSEGLGAAARRVPKGAFAALRTDMYKDWDADPERFKRSPFPGLVVRDHQISLRAARRHGDRPRERWTPTPPTRWIPRPTFSSTAIIRSKSWPISTRCRDRRADRGDLAESEGRSRLSGARFCDFALGIHV